MGQSAFVVYLFTVISIFFPQQAFAAGGWVNDWLGGATYSGANYAIAAPGVINGSSRTYMSGGAISARFPVTTEYPITIERPRLKAGCGGIDGFMGGFSYLKLDYLVAKFNRMIQNAPAMAFGIAMQTVAAQVDKKLEAYESIINDLNGIAINECALVNDGMNETKRRYNAYTDTSQATGQTDMRADAGKDQMAAGGLPTKNDSDPSGPLSTCSGDIKDLFADTSSPGSLIEKMTMKIGMTDPNLQGIIRAYVGDMETVPAYDMNAQITVSWNLVNPCPATTGSGGVTLDDLVNGESWTRGWNAVGATTCVKNTGTNANLVIYSTSMVTNILNKIKTRTALSPSEKTFVYFGNIGTDMKIAVIKGNDAQQTESIAKKAAYMLAYSIFRDMVNNSQIALDKVIEITQKKQSTATCNHDLFTEPVKKNLGVLWTRAREIHAMLNTDENKKQMAMLNAGNLEANLTSREGESYRATADQFKRVLNRKRGG